MPQSHHKCKFLGNSFSLKKGRRAVILLHGFTASTQEMERLGRFLHKQGFTVIAPLLVGHNTSFDDFSRTTANDYFQSALDAYDSIKGSYESVDVIGLSFGAVLAINLAHARKVRRLVLLAPAIFFRNPLHNLVIIFQVYKGKVHKALKKNSRTAISCRWDLNSADGIERRIAYPFFAFPQLESVRRFAVKTKGILPQIKCPAMIFHSLADMTTHPRSSQFIHDHIGSEDKSILFLKKSGHIITEDVEQEIVWNKTYEFLNLQ